MGIVGVGGDIRSRVRIRFIGLWIRFEGDVEFGIKVCWRCRAVRSGRWG